MMKVCFGMFAHYFLAEALKKWYSKYPSRVISLPALKEELLVVLLSVISTSQFYAELEQILEGENGRDKEMECYSWLLNVIQKTFHQYGKENSHLINLTFISEKVEEVLLLIFEQHKEELDQLSAFFSTYNERTLQLSVTENENSILFSLQNNGGETLDVHCYQKDQLSAQIMTFLTKNKEVEYFTISDLAKAIGLRRDFLRTVLDRLIKNGFLRAYSTGNQSAVYSPTFRI